MQLLTVSGFLGSGKTTLILHLADAALKRRLVPAVVVNEIGSMGIDDLLMRRLDLNVYQLLGGCICCTLVSDLPLTLEKLVRDYSPDVVMIEPSGAARLDKVYAGLAHYRGEPFDRVRSLVLLDALRFESLIRTLTPLMISQIDSADIVLLNKTDAATDRQVESCRRILAEVKPDKDIILSAATHGIAPVLLEELMP